MQLRAKGRDVEVAAEHAEIAIKNNTQQMKHLQYENQSKIGEHKAETMIQMKAAQEDHAKQELELLNDKREVRRQLHEAQEMAELQMEQLQMKQSEFLALVIFFCEIFIIDLNKHLCFRQERSRYMREASEMSNLHEQKLQEYVEESEIRHRMEMFEIEERKKDQLSKIIGSHQQAFKELRNYYNDITLNNLALISTIKEQMEELRDRSEKTEKNMAMVYNIKSDGI